MGFCLPKNKSLPLVPSDEIPSFPFLCRLGQFSIRYMIKRAVVNDDDNKNDDVRICGKEVPRPLEWPTQMPWFYGLSLKLCGQRNHLFQAAETSTPLDYPLKYYSQKHALHERAFCAARTTHTDISVHFDAIFINSILSSHSSKWLLILNHSTSIKPWIYECWVRRMVLCWKWISICRRIGPFPFKFKCYLWKFNEGFRHLGNRIFP